MVEKLKKGSQKAKKRMSEVRSHIGNPKRKKRNQTVSFKAKGKNVSFRAKV